MIQITNMKKYIFLFIIVVAIGTGGINFYLNRAEQEKEFSIDPQIQIDPQKEYKIVYWDYPLLWGIKENYEEFLKQKIADFEKQYPNIKVEYKLLSPINGLAKLKKSLAQGTPPDIYNAVFGTKIVADKLQIPINLLATEEELKTYHSAAIKSFDFQNQIWGLPQMIFPQVWLGNENLLKEGNINLTKIYHSGWDWGEFRGLAQELNNLESHPKIIFNPDNEQLLIQLLGSANRLNAVEKEKSIIDSLDDSFQLLEDLRKDKIFLSPEDKMGEKFLASFWKGKAGLIGPVTPWLLNNIYQQAQKHPEVSLTLLPVPVKELAEEDNFLIETTGLLLFRQEEYQGDDHSKAVYKFAKYINNQHNLYTSLKLNLVPAHNAESENWIQNSKLAAKLKTQLLSYARDGRPTMPIAFEDYYLKNILRENYPQFWLNELSASQIMKEIKNDYKKSGKIN